METKEIIEILKKANEWRRGWEWEMPDPKIFWIAIDETINLLSNK